MLLKFIVAPTDGRERSQNALTKRMELKKLIVGGVAFLYMIDLALERTSISWASPVNSARPDVVEHEGQKTLNWALEQVTEAGRVTLCTLSRALLVQRILEQVMKHDLNVVGVRGTHGTLADLMKT